MKIEVGKVDSQSEKSRYNLILYIYVAKHIGRFNICSHIAAFSG